MSAPGRLRSAWSAHASVEQGFLALLLLFVATHVDLLGSLQHSIDEGTNVYAARLIGQGAVPFRDFLYHQPPLYLYLLALLPTDHIAYGRALSLLAICGSGAVLFRLVRQMLPGAAPVALLSSGLFYFAGLQYWGMLALPNSCMLFFALSGAYLALYRPRRSVVQGAICMVLAVLFKPIVIPVILAVALALAVAPDRRREVLPFALTVGVGGALSYLALHALSDGAFSDLVYLQWLRYSGQSVFELLQSLPLLRSDLEHLTPLSLNLLFHVDSFASADAALWLLGAPSLWSSWRHGRDLAPTGRMLASAWLLLSMLFVLFVSDVSWQHYHLLYLPPLSLFAALTLWRIAARGRVARLAVVALCLGYASAGIATVRAQRQDYSGVLALRGSRAALLAFDPTVNVLSRTEAPCGVLDYLAQTSPRFYRDEFARFGVSSADLVACLERAPEIGILIHDLSDTSLLFVDRELSAYIRRQPPERVVFLSESARRAFEALP